VSLTEKQHLALLTLYAEEGSRDEWEGDTPIHPQRMRALQARGLCAPLPAERDEDGPRWCITEVGKRALGVVWPRKPKTLRPALKRAIRAICPWIDDPDEAICRPGELPWRYDQEPDYSGALFGVIDPDSVSPLGDAGVHWAAVGAMLRDGGFDVVVDYYRGVVVIWPEDD
jgi:hypothetical protein